MGGYSHHGSTYSTRVKYGQGADVASANDLTLGTDGNTFEITGTTQINAITTSGWQNGSIITLLFASSLTVKNNTSGGAGTAVILLDDGLDFLATAGDVIQLVLSEIGGTQAWREVEAEKGIGVAAGLFVSTADATVANTTDATTLIASGEGSVTLPANFLTVGKSLLLLAKGHISDTANPTITFVCSLGGTTVCSSAALTLGSVSNDYWEAEIEIVCRSVGASGTVVASGEFVYENSQEMSGVGLVKTTTTTVDTTGSLALDFTAAWGTASASNTITCQIFNLEELD